MKTHIHQPLTSRAGLSPLRSGKVIRSRPIPRTPTAANLTLRFEPAPVLPPRDGWPEWHRGALDRLKPVLTRYRD